MPSSPTIQSPESLIVRLRTSTGYSKVKALRDLKNQIIGNRTKKISYINLGAVQPVVDALSSSFRLDLDTLESESDTFESKSDRLDPDREFGESILVQSAAVLGSFACGVDFGVKAVIEAGAFPYFIRLISHSNHKVVDACSRSLRMIYQSKLAPKYDLLLHKNMEFILSLLNSENENLVGLGLSIITHSCETIAEQNALAEAGVLNKLVSLVERTLIQRDTTLESLVRVLRNNAQVVSKFVEAKGGRGLNCVTELTKDRHPRARLFACICLIVIRNVSSCYLQEMGIKTKLILILLELQDDPSQVGVEASFALSSLISEKEDLHKLAFEANAVDKLGKHLQVGSSQTKRIQGILLALADLCAKLECCRSRFLSLQVLSSVIDALTHDSAEVRATACICIKSVSRSVKNLSAGYFMNEKVVIPLVQLLYDPCTSVQVEALRAISNIVVDFTPHKSTFVQCGGVKQLAQLSRSMDSAIRLNAVWALRNLMFLADNKCKEGIFFELTASLLASLICDHEPFVQEQALGLVRNLVDGCIDSVQYVFAEDSMILNAVGRQLQSSSRDEVGIQGMYALSNVATGSEFHKDSVMHQILSETCDNSSQPIVLKFLQSNDSRLRTSAIWTVLNLTYPTCPGAHCRILKLRNAGVVSHIKTMVEDACLDVKLRAKIIIRQSMTFGSPQ